MVINLSPSPMFQAIIALMLYLFATLSLCMFSWIVGKFLAKISGMKERSGDIDDSFGVFFIMVTLVVQAVVGLVIIKAYVSPLF